jgi:hypothetical protein
MPWIEHNGITMHICTRGTKRQRCHFCNRWSEKLCDFPTGKNGKTCDARMCSRCASSVGPDLDYCPRHRGMKPAQGTLALTEAR